MNTLPEKTQIDPVDENDLPEITEIDGEGETISGFSAQHNIENIPIKISAVLGKTKIDVAKLRTLGDGAIIELNRKVGEPIDLYVNDRLIARGELVMVDGSLGVTMTEIVKEDDL